MLMREGMQDLIRQRISLFDLDEKGAAETIRWRMRLKTSRNTYASVCAPSLSANRRKKNSTNGSGVTRKVTDFND